MCLTNVAESFHSHTYNHLDEFCNMYMFVFFFSVTVVNQFWFDVTTFLTHSTLKAAFSGPPGLDQVWLRAEFSIKAYEML